MNQQLTDEQQEEYETRIMIFATDFKNNFYVTDFEDGFCSAKFVGTQKEYDEATQKYYRNHDLGKIIGTFKYTPEEWNKKHPPVKYPTPVKSDYIKGLEKKWAEEWADRAEDRRKAVLRRN